MTMPRHPRTSPSRRSPYRLPERGFSLMEGMTVLGIMTIVLVIVSQVFAATYDVFVKQSARSDNETGAVIATRTISDMTRGASQVMEDRVINGTTYVSGPDSLVLKMPAIDPGGNVIAGSSDYIAFYRDGSAATKIFSDTDAAAGSRRVDGKKLVTAYNETMRFRYNDPELTDATRIQVYLVNRQTVRGTTVITTKGWTAIFLRNAE